MKKKKIVIPEKKSQELFVKTQRKDGQPQYVMLEKVSGDKSRTSDFLLFWTCIVVLGLIAIISAFY